MLIISKTGRDPFRVAVNTQQIWWGGSTPRVAEFGNPGLRDGTPSGLPYQLLAGAA